MNSAASNNVFSELTPNSYRKYFLLPRHNYTHTHLTYLKDAHNLLQKLVSKRLNPALNAQNVI